VIALADGETDERRVHGQGVAGGANGDAGEEGGACRATAKTTEQAPNKALHPTPAGAMMSRRGRTPAFGGSNNGHDHGMMRSDRDGRLSLRRVKVTEVGALPLALRDTRSVAGHSNRAEGSGMAEYGEWNRKGASLSDVTAAKEYGVTRAFIVKGIRAGKLEYREGAIWGNPYLRILRGQLEQYIAEQFGPERLASEQSKTELRKIKKEIADLNKRLAQLEGRRMELEKALRD